MRSGAFKNLCHIQIYTVKWTYEPIWESIFSVFWASGVLKSIFPDLSAPKEARETKKIHLKFFIQKGLPPTWETTVKWMGVDILSQKLLEEGTWRGQNHLVCLHLLTIFTDQGDISEALVRSQVSKGGADVILEVIPLKTQLFWCCHFFIADTKLMLYLINYSFSLEI